MYRLFSVMLDHLCTNREDKKQYKIETTLANSSVSMVCVCVRKYMENFEKMPFSLLPCKSLNSMSSLTKVHKKRAKDRPESSIKGRGM